MRSAVVCRRALPALTASRLVWPVVENPRLEEDGVFTALLKALAGAHPDKTCLLISCADGYTMQLARCRSALAPYYRFACPAPDIVARLGTKQGFAEVCAAEGLRTPKVSRCPAVRYCRNCRLRGRSSSNRRIRPRTGTVTLRENARST